MKSKSKKVFKSKEDELRFNIGYGHTVKKVKLAKEQQKRQQEPQNQLKRRLEIANHARQAMEAEKRREQK